MRFVDIGPPIALEEVEAWERRYECAIPDPYKLFLLRMNGGRPERRGFHFHRNSGARSGETFDSFAGIGGDYDLGYLHETYVARDRVPHDLFPIGSVEGGGLLLMGKPGRRFGKVYFWDHDFESSEGEPPTERNVYFLADTLQEFIDNLEPILVLV